MTDVIVNESRFVIDISDEVRDDFLQDGTMLPDGTLVGALEDRAAEFQIFNTQDGRFNLLCVKEPMARRWIEEGYLKEEYFYKYQKEDGQSVYILLSPSSLILQRASASRSYGSRRFALSFAAALSNTRDLNHAVNLRDAIFCEVYGVLLPAYTKTREVADRALFKNVLSKDQSEDISGKDELKDNSGLNWHAVRAELGKASLPLPPIDPYLQHGEIVDDFAGNAQGLRVTGPLCLNENYQLYDTNSDKVLLLMENSWADKLSEHDLILHMNLNNVSGGGLFLKALLLSKRYAVEPLDDRHCGLTAQGSFKLAQAVSRSRLKAPKARLDNALYLEELGVLLPVQFEGNNLRDSDLVRKIVTAGPFALAPFLEDHIEQCAAIAEIS